MKERTLALLDDGLDVADAVTGLGVDGHSAGKGLHKELHGSCLVELFKVTRLFFSV